MGKEIEFFQAHSFSGALEDERAFAPDWQGTSVNELIYSLGKVGARQGELEVSKV